MRSVRVENSCHGDVTDVIFQLLAFNSGFMVFISLDIRGCLQVPTELCGGGRYRKTSG